MNIIAREPGETFLIIREKYVALCNGNVVAAALIHIFEQWHINKLKTKRQLNEPSVAAGLSSQQKFLIDNLYQWHTTAQLEEYLLGLGKKDAIIAARRQLESMSIISEHKNPFQTFDNTTFFVFYPEQLNQLLEFRKSSAENRGDAIGKPPTTKAEPSSENRHYTNIHSIHSNKDFKVDADASTADSSTTKKNKGLKDKGPDKQWANWVKAWFDFFQSRNDGREPIFNGPQQKGLKDLRKYLVKISAAQDGDPDDNGLKVLEYIFANWDRLDDWQRSVFDLTVIVKKINEFINRIKNGTETNRSTDQNGGKSGISQSREQALRDY